MKLLLIVFLFFSFLALLSQRMASTFQISINPSCSHVADKMVLRVVVFKSLFYKVVKIRHKDLASVTR